MKFDLCRANAQQPKLFVGMILILIFAEALALYGLIGKSCSYLCLHVNNNIAVCYVRELESYCPRRADLVLLCNGIAMSCMAIVITVIHVHKQKMCKSCFEQQMTLPDAIFVMQLASSWRQRLVSRSRFVTPCQGGTEPLASYAWGRRVWPNLIPAMSFSRVCYQASTSP